MVRLGDALLVSGDRDAARSAWHEVVRSGRGPAFGPAADAEAFRTHLEEFRAVVGLAYPWLVQDMVRYARWQLPENHPILLVGRDGVVEMAVRGPDLESFESALEMVRERE